MSDLYYEILPPVASQTPGWSRVLMLDLTRYGEIEDHTRAAQTFFMPHVEAQSLSLRDWRIKPRVPFGAYVEELHTFMIDVLLQLHVVFGDQVTDYIQDSQETLELVDYGVRWLLYRSEQPLSREDIGIMKLIVESTRLKYPLMQIMTSHKADVDPQWDGEVMSVSLPLSDVYPLVKSRLMVEARILKDALDFSYLDETNDGE